MAKKPVRNPLYADAADTAIDNRWQTSIGVVSRKALLAFEKFTAAMK